MSIKGTITFHEIRELLAACQDNDESTLSQILENHNLADYGEELIHALHIALTSGLTSIAKQLLAKEEVRTYAADHDNHALFLAAEKGDLDVMTELLKIPSVYQNAASSHNLILQVAAGANQLEAVELLLTIDSVRNNAAALHNRALRQAHRAGHKEMIRLLFTIPEIKEFYITGDRIDREVRLMIHGIVKVRYQKKIDAFEANAPSSAEFIKEKFQLQKELNIEKALMHRIQNDYLLEEYFLDFYDHFCDECLMQDNTLSESDCKKMFLGLIREIYLAKLNIHETWTKERSSPIARVMRVEHESKVRVMWTPAQEKASEALRERLDEVFLPLKDIKPAKINLYAKKGFIRAAETGSSIHLDHPPSVIFTNVSQYIEELFYPNSKDKKSHLYKQDLALLILIWNALSIQYVSHTNGNDIDVFLPNGEISTSSIFWNYELNTLRKNKMATDQSGSEIHYHVLKQGAMIEIHNCKTLMKNLQVQLDKIQNDESDPADEQIQLTNEIETLDEKIYIITAKESNWREVPFENIKIKGLIVNQKDFTIGALLRVTDLMKERIEKIKLKKLESQFGKLSFAYDKLTERPRQDPSSSKSPIDKKDKGKEKKRI